MAAENCGTYFGGESFRVISFGGLGAGGVGLELLDSIVRFDIVTCFAPRFNASSPNLKRMLDLLAIKD